MESTLTLLGLTLAGGLLVAIGTIKQNRWGISRSQKVCPRCGTARALGQSPRSLGEVLWGGWTCRNCNQPLDKWGRRGSRATRDRDPALEPAPPPPVSFGEYLTRRFRLGTALGQIIATVVVLFCVVYGVYAPQSIPVSVVALVLLYHDYQSRSKRESQ